MFGPTPNISICETLDYSHREPKFFDLIDSTSELLKERFDLGDFDILFLSGSGTLALEALISSVRYPVNVTGPDGKFKRRWSALADQYNLSKAEKEPIELFCAFETSVSQSHSQSHGIVDAVSAFPYYAIPPKTVGFGTVSSKILGAAPVIGIVGVRKEAWDFFFQTKIQSCLNLRIYKDYMAKFQTPFTPSYPLLADLKRKLERFDVEALREKVSNVCSMLVNHFGEDSFIGEKIAPALTLKAGSISEEIARKWNLYGYWQHSEYLQIFTYSEDVKIYKNFLHDLRSDSRQRVKKVKNAKPFQVSESSIC